MNYWVTAVCETNGIKIHHTRTGGSKPPIILLYGLMTSGVSYWAGFAHAHVMEQEYDVIIPNA